MNLLSTSWNSYQIIWTTIQASRDANSNSLEQFQLVDSTFKLFAPLFLLFVSFTHKFILESKMFGLRSNQSGKSMMFGSNKLERGIIFVTVHYIEIAVYFFGYAFSTLAIL